MTSTEVSMPELGRGTKRLPAGMACAAFLGLVLFSCVLSAQQNAPDGSYFTNWILLGPLPADTSSPEKALELAGGPDASPRNGQKVTMPERTTLRWLIRPGPASCINLCNPFGLLKQGAALAYCEIVAEQDGLVLFHLGTSNRHVVWINGVQVAQGESLRETFLSDRSFTAPLHRGVNRCLVFVSHDVVEPYWGFMLRVEMSPAAPVPPVIWNPVVPMNPNTRQYYLLSPDWRYQVGDNPRWARDDFEDRDWPKVRDGQIPASAFAAGNRPQTVWLRVRAEVTREAVVVPFLLETDYGATCELYVDGQRIGAFGRWAPLFRSPNMLSEIFQFRNSQTVIAMRWRVAPAPSATWVDVPPVCLRDYQYILKNMARETSLYWHRVIIILIMVVFFHFHAGLYVFYPPRRENLYFSLALLTTILAVFVLHLAGLSVSKVQARALYWVYLACMPLASVAAFGLVHVAGRGTLSMGSFFVFLFVGLGVYIFAWVDNQTAVVSILPALVAAEWLRVYFTYVFRKWEGYWLIGAGLACYIIGLLLDAITTFREVFPSAGLNAYPGWYGFCGFMACMSVYFARGFAGATQQLETLAFTLEDRVLRRTRELDLEVQERSRAEDQVRNLTRQLLGAQEAERERISRDLHDHVGQELWSARLICDTLAESEKSPSGVRSKAGRASQLLEGAIAAVRDMAYGLRPPGLDTLGFISTASRFCKDMAKSTGLIIEFQDLGIENRHLTPEMAINLFRLLQESLNNVRLHARARRVFVRIAASSSTLLLSIEDDGQGFDVEARTTDALQEKHMGLWGMKERAALLKGKLTIDSTPGKGTRVTVEVPCSTA